MGAVAVALYLVRAMGRRWRRHRRREARSLIRLLRGHLRGQVPTETLARAANALESARFWATIEQLPLRDRRARRPFPKPSTAAVTCGRSASACETSPRGAASWPRDGSDSCTRGPRGARARRALVHGPELVTLAAGVALARHRDRRALRWLLAHPRTIARRQRSALVALFGAFGRRGLPRARGGARAWRFREHRGACDGRCARPRRLTAARATRSSGC